MELSNGVKFGAKSKLTSNEVMALKEKRGAGVLTLKIVETEHSGVKIFSPR